LGEALGAAKDKSPTKQELEMAVYIRSGLILENITGLLI